MQFLPHLILHPVGVVEILIINVDMFMVDLVVGVVVLVEEILIVQVEAIMLVVARCNFVMSTIIMEHASIREIRGNVISLIYVHGVKVNIQDHNVQIIIKRLLEIFKKTYVYLFA